ncbi:MAG: hypothetical protein Q7R40_18430 [Phaeospirillum sp.]|nr:hypothetical protein [Phaeospirillum sp.]
MTVTPLPRLLPATPISPVSYDQTIWTHLKAFEGAVGRIYTDSQGIPTMGAGAALAVIGRDRAWVLRPAAEIGVEISGDPQAPYRFSAEEWQRLTLCLHALRQPDPQRAQALIPPFAPRHETPAHNRFGFTLSEARIRAVALAKWAAARRAVLGDLTAEAGRRGWGESAKAMIQAYAFSHQEAGLASVRYNIGTGRAMPKASAALLDGDRAALWYEIACNTNPPGNGAGRGGIARRRLAEAQLACGSPDRWNPAEQAGLEALFSRNADKMAAYRRAVPEIFPLT